MTTEGARLYQCWVDSTEALDEQVTLYAHAKSLDEATAMFTARLREGTTTFIVGEADAATYVLTREEAGALFAAAMVAITSGKLLEALPSHEADLALTTAMAKLAWSQRR
jgi:hypothetical protein